MNFPQTPILLFLSFGAGFDGRPTMGNRCNLLIRTRGFSWHGLHGQHRV